MHEPILRRWRRKIEQYWAKRQGNWEYAGEPTILPADFSVTYPDCPECGREFESKFGKNGVKCECGYSSGGGAI